MSQRSSDVPMLVNFFYIYVSLISSLNWLVSFMGLWGQKIDIL